MRHTHADGELRNSHTKRKSCLHVCLSSPQNPAQNSPEKSSRRLSVKSTGNIVSRLPPVSFYRKHKNLMKPRPRPTVCGLRSRASGLWSLGPRARVSKHARCLLRYTSRSHRAFHRFQRASPQTASLAAWRVPRRRSSRFSAAMPRSTCSAL